MVQFANERSGASERIGAIRFVVSPPRGDCLHYVDADDVRVVLGRLPLELFASLREVHFNSRPPETLGYVTRGRRSVSLCALPPRVRLTGSIPHRGSPAEFGACRNQPWPRLAVRRYMLYDVLLHEIGHLQVVDAHARSVRRRYGHETFADEFAATWRRRLWSASDFSHPDPVHFPPSKQEIEGAAAPLL